MTTLFNLFCPYIFGVSMIISMWVMALVSLIFMSYFLLALIDSAAGLFIANIVVVAFPLGSSFSFVMIWFCMILAAANLLSLTVYSFPLTTTMMFNFSAALSFWLSGVVIQSTKHFSVSSVLPSNSPWYLISFLSVVELISIVVRPITLCFRLLANMSAGHILLTLICKMSLGLWFLGSLFGLLELMVSMVQSFVFLMLIGVYFEEAMSH